MWVTTSPTPKGRPAGAPAADVSASQADGYVPQTQYVQAAKDVPDVNKQAVAEARELLKSGKLDTPEAAQRAAENMLNLGI